MTVNHFRILKFVSLLSLYFTSTKVRQILFTNWGGGEITHYDSGMVSNGTIFIKIFVENRLLVQNFRRWTDTLPQKNTL